MGLYISGTNTKKREEFNRMIAECMEGHINLRNHPFSTLEMINKAGAP